MAQPTRRCAAALRRPPPSGSRKYAAILETAEAHFGELGFKKANVDAIAAGAGVSKPLIYRYFASKRRLFEVVVDGVVSEWCDVITAEAARRVATSAERLRLVLGASLEFARSRSVLRGLLARESQLLLYEFSDVLDRGTATLRSVLLDIIEAGAASGEIRRDLECATMADFLTEVCEGFANRLISQGAGSRDALRIDTVVEIALDGVVAPPGPHAEG